MTSKIIEPWRQMAEDVIGRRPAVAALLELHGGNPNVPFWDQSARNALAGDTEVQRVYGRLAMRSAPILRDMERQYEALMARSVFVDRGPSDA